MRGHFTTISKKCTAQGRKQEGATGLGGENLDTDRRNY